MTARNAKARRDASPGPFVPPECRAFIDGGALVAVNVSGGKDSHAMTILLSRLVPHERLVAVHAPLGEVEWPGTMEHIERTIPPSVPLILAPSRRARRCSNASRSAAYGPPIRPGGARRISSDRLSSASCAATNPTSTTQSGFRLI